MLTYDININVTTDFKSIFKKPKTHCVHNVRNRIYDINTDVTTDLKSIFKKPNTRRCVLKNLMCFNTSNSGEFFLH